MALIACPECGHSVSEQAVACPECACPIAARIAPETRSSRYGGDVGTLLSRRAEQENAAPAMRRGHSAENGLIITAIAVYIEAGYHVTNQLNNQVQLCRPKMPPVRFATFWLLFLGIGWVTMLVGDHHLILTAFALIVTLVPPLIGVVVYALYYLAKKNDVVTLTTNRSGDLVAHVVGHSPAVIVRADGLVDHRKAISLFAKIGQIACPYNCGATLGHPVGHSDSPCYRCKRTISFDPTGALRPV